MLPTINTGGILSSTIHTKFRNKKCKHPASWQAGQ